MRKEKGSTTSNFIKAFVNPRAWSSYDMMVEIWGYLKETFFRLFVPKPRRQFQNLDDVMIKLSLSEKDLQERKKVFLRMAILMFVLSALTFIYVLYYLLYAEYLVVGIGSALILLTLAFAFRYHFWYFQLEKGKLGCTFKEWLRQGLLGAKE